MKSRTKFLILAYAILVPGLLAAQSFDGIQVETTPLSDTLYLVTRAGGNIAALVGDDGVLLVDSGFEQMHAKLKAAVAGLSNRPVRYVLNTHWHFDHVGGNGGFADNGAAIVAHGNIRRTMASGLHLAVLERDVPPSAESALPAITFDEDLVLYLNGEEIRIHHYPGAHSGGDGVVRFVKANVIHVGDIFFNCGYPFIDVNDGGNIDGLIAAVKSILESCDEKTRIIPGHGPMATRDDLATYLSMLKGFRDAVAAEIAAGKDLQAILEGNATASLDEKWGNVFFPPPSFTELVYLSLTK
jgi:glyoxylase-like metal-dependent hydrolase (beta-lactamase superfamily II)